MDFVIGKRNRRIGKLFHVISKQIIDLALSRHIGKIVIGHNRGQKQGLDLGKRFNQNFGLLPIFKFVSMIRYKAELQGIEVIEITEEYTGKASFLDGDPIPDRKTTKKKSNGHSDVTFSGNRITRGLYVSKEGKRIHADVNGAYNIIRKECPDAFTMLINLVKLHPRRIDVSINDSRKKSLDIFGWNRAGGGHYPKPVNNPVSN